MSSPRELLEEYRVERALWVAPSTLKGESFYTERFLGFLDSQGVHQVGEISFEMLDGYRELLETGLDGQGKPLSACYRYKSVAYPRSFLVWASRRGHTLVDFESYPLPSQERVEVLPPTPAQVERLLAAPDTSKPTGLRTLLIMESFYSLALRRAESHRLNIGDLDFRRRVVRVSGKPQRERLLPLSDRLSKLLQRYLDEARPAFRPLPEEEALWVSSSTGERLGEVVLRSCVTTISERLGLGKIYPHLLRHACATHLHEAGAELCHIRDFLGHSTIASTERYVHVGAAELGRFVRDFHPRQSEDSP